MTGEAAPLGAASVELPNRRATRRLARRIGAALAPGDALILSGPLLVALLVGVSVLGLEWFRRTQLPRLRFGENDAEYSAAMVASIMVFYGLATALTAVNVWETNVRVEEITKLEAPYQPKPVLDHG